MTAESQIVKLDRIESKVDTIVKMLSEMKNAQTTPATNAGLYVSEDEMVHLRGLYNDLLDHTEEMNTWERGFMLSMNELISKRLTPKQARKLRDIYGDYA